MTQGSEERNAPDRRGRLTALGTGAGVVILLLVVAGIVITQDLPGSNALTLIAGWLLAPLMVVLDAMGMPGNSPMLVPVALVGFSVVFLPAIVRIAFARPRRLWVAVAVQLLVLIAYVGFGAMLTVAGL